MCAELHAYYKGVDKEKVVAVMSTERNTKLNCDHYKDKSLCVELPCKVGYTLYVIRDPKIFKEKIAEYKVVSIAFLLSSCCKHLSITTENYRGANILFELDDFGKTVFLTKEEAERKLKEMGE
jgi:hypothetical protein